MKSLDAGKRAVAYIRVSTKGQEEEGLSLETQETRIRAWATLSGAVLIAVITESKSAKTASDRPEFMRAFRLACDQKAALVVVKLDRFARDTRNAIDLAEELGEAGGDLVSLSEHIDTTTANGVFVFTVFAALAKLERDRIAERTQEVMDLKRSRDECLGPAPYGFRPSGRKVIGLPPPMLVPVEVEQVTLARMVELWGPPPHRPYAEVVRGLNRAGMLSRAGTDWSCGQVRRILLARASGRYPRIVDILA